MNNIDYYDKYGWKENVLSGILIHYSNILHTFNLKDPSNTVNPFKHLSLFVYDDPQN